MSTVVFPTSEISSSTAPNEVNYDERADIISPATLRYVLRGVAEAIELPTPDLKPSKPKAKPSKWNPEPPKTDLKPSTPELMPPEPDLKPPKPYSKPEEPNLKPLAKFISSQTEAFESRYWLDLIEFRFSGNEFLLQIAKITLGVSILRTKCRPVEEPVRSINQEELDSAWSLVYDALTSPSLLRTLFRVNRSAQGFLAVPLFSLVVDGLIKQLFRLHVWLPDGKRGNADCSIHSHQAYAHSWTLAGMGLDHRYRINGVDEPRDATHAAYALSWDGGKGKSTAYKTHHSSSAIENTGFLVQATHSSSASYERNMDYGIPSMHFHRSEVGQFEFHATLFFFDSDRGFTKDAPVLGPVDGVAFEQLREPIGHSAAELAHMVENMRNWEQLMAKGKDHAARADLEQALKAFNDALTICQREDVPNPVYYRSLTLGELGKVSRRLGHYEKARALLKTALEKMPANQARIDLSIELGVVLRHIDRLEEAKTAFEDWYLTATKLGLESSICRAIGNLGTVNLLLFRKNGDQKLLEQATSQLEDRVQLARNITKKILDQPASDENTRKRRAAQTSECIGLSRLSICYTAASSGGEDDIELVKAFDAASESLKLAREGGDATVLAMSHYFYGRVLLNRDLPKDALQHFNARGTSSSSGGCTPAIAFCKEPSAEHLSYLQELIDVGADLSVVDDDGYSALDWAVFSGIDKAKALVREGLCNQLTISGVVDEVHMNRLMYEAELRKGYRALFQDKLRPVLTSAADLVKSDNNAAVRGIQTLATLRQVYAQALTADSTRAPLFDPLRVLRYTDLLKHKRLPRYSNGITALLDPPQSAGGPKTENHVGEDFVIFVSYRWLNGSEKPPRPDDDNNTRYDRVVKAVESLLDLHPLLERDRLALWIDYACINQDDSKAGVAAIPMLLAQCNAVITLLDDHYMRRAWCCVEMAMIQILKNSYGLHLWYVQHEDGILKPSDIDEAVSVQGKDLSIEADRPKVAFLERQSKLLGRA